MTGRLQVGIDFSRKRADFSLLSPEGERIATDLAFPNSVSGYGMAKQLLLETVQAHGFDGVDVSGEATGNYWLPFFLQLASDPHLAAYDRRLFVLEPRRVRWYKKSYGPEDKTDRTDPFYVADRTRTMPHPLNWEPDLDIMPLRFYTRLRFHLTQQLAREKCFLSSYLFLKASGYAQASCFSDTFGRTSCALLSDPGVWDRAGDLSEEELAALLDELSGHRLRDPHGHAAKLRQALDESFVLPQCLQEPLQRIVDVEIANVRFLLDQIAKADRDIAREAEKHPGVRCLASVPGIGPVFSSGIVAEIGSLQRFLAPPKWDARHRTYRRRNLRDAEDAVAKIAGLWWPRRASGDFVGEDRRLSRAGNRYLRYYLILAANGLRRLVPEYRAFYARKYRAANKHRHWRALVLTARKSVGLIVGLLHRNEAWRSEET